MSSYSICIKQFIPHHPSPLLNSHGNRQNTLRYVRHKWQQISCHTRPIFQVFCHHKQGAWTIFFCPRGEKRPQKKSSWVLDKFRIAVFIQDRMRHIWIPVVSTPRRERFSTSSWQQIIPANFRTCQLAWLDEKRSVKFQNLNGGGVGGRRGKAGIRARGLSF